MGAVCCCFESRRNHSITGFFSSNSTAENIEHGRHEQKSEPKKECIIVLSPKNIAENIDEIVPSSQAEETEKSEDRLRHVFSSWEDEDVCPTCYEDYTPENPKIIANCNHHYHLGCIYDWLERSPTCPTCGKLMEFEGMQ